MKIDRELIMTLLFMVQEKKMESKYSIGERKFTRLNPYNPLCYLWIAVILIISFPLYGIVGIKEDFSNPFKWS